MKEHMYTQLYDDVIIIIIKVILSGKSQTFIKVTVYVAVNNLYKGLLGTYYPWNSTQSVYSILIEFTGQEKDIENKNIYLIHYLLGSFLGFLVSSVFKHEGLGVINPLQFKTKRSKITKIGYIYRKFGDLSMDV